MSVASQKQKNLMTQLRKQFAAVRIADQTHARETQAQRTARLLAGKSVSYKLGRGT